MLDTSIFSGLQISTSNEALALRRIQKHSFCTAFIVILLKTGERSQLKNTRFTAQLGGNSHADDDGPPSSPKNVNAPVQPLLIKFIKHLD